MKCPVHLRVALCAALLLPACAMANDGIATVGAGGIVLRKTDAIAMKKEVLNVSHDLITVDYEFLNESPADIEETIVFPLPAYPATQQVSDSYYGQPSGFSILVDGKPVAFTAHVRAELDGKDVTAELRRLGLDDVQIAFNTEFEPRPKVTPLTARQRKELTRLGLLEKQPGNEGDALWQVQVNYVWKQKFPANRTLRVHHAYRPFVGAGPGNSWIDPEFAATYCADKSFFAAYEKVEARNDGHVIAAHVAYILKTGNTWKRGIEDFTLNIVKRDPAELVSLCFPGTVKKLDSKTYQVRLKNFQPRDDLRVYFGNVRFDADHAGVMPQLRK